MSHLWKLCLFINVLAFAAQAQVDVPVADDDVPSEGDDVPLQDESVDMHAGGSEGDDPFDHGHGVDEDFHAGNMGKTEAGSNLEEISTQQAHKLHEKIDANGDGKITAEELATFSMVARTEMLKKEAGSMGNVFDGNEDGKVSLEEFLRGGGVTLDESLESDARKAEELELEKQKFKIADSNKDGFLDNDELAVVFYPEVHPESLELVARINFKSRDKDQDGLLSHEEFWGVPMAVDDGPQEAHGDSDEVEFAALDTDRDGKLSFTELLRWESGAHHSQQAMTHLMELADADKDGSISKAELDEAREPLATSPAYPHLHQWVEHYDLHKLHYEL